MSRAEQIRARYEAELEVAELEDELVAAKEAGEVPRELKLQLREARRQFRLERAGSAQVSPATVEVVAGVEEIGG